MDSLLSQISSWGSSTSPAPGPRSRASQHLQCQKVAKKSRNESEASKTTSVIVDSGTEQGGAMTSDGVVNDEGAHAKDKPSNSENTETEANSNEVDNGKGESTGVASDNVKEDGSATKESTQDGSIWCRAYSR